MKTLYSVNEVRAMILRGEKLLLAGEEALLSQLPQGHWVGGTIPYFMSENGGCQSSEMIQVGFLPDFVTEMRAVNYYANELKNIPADYPKNGVSFIMIPAFSEAHQVFAKDCSTFSGLFDSPLLGWVTGFNLNSQDRKFAKVYNGMTSECFTEKAVVLHLEIAKNKFAQVNIINLFKQGHGDSIRFKSTGFEVSKCFINGVETNFADYLLNRNTDTKLPMVADYSGALINVSIMSVDKANNMVKLYAPVFADVEYKFADPIGNYESEFAREVTSSELKRPSLSCNCVLNYLYANLEGKRTGNIMGPMTFGEIAYMLLNQTVVYLTFENRMD